MALGPDAIDRLLIADEAGTALQPKGYSINLPAVGGINIEINQASRWMVGFQANAALLHDRRINVEPK